LPISGRARLSGGFDDVAGRNAETVEQLFGFATAGIRAPRNFTVRPRRRRVSDGVADTANLIVILGDDHAGARFSAADRPE
jgi:hypothetical protein